jgi:serine protease
MNIRSMDRIGHLHLFQQGTNSFRKSTAWFQWTRGSEVTDSWLYVGTALGAADLFNHEEGVKQGAMVTGLPTNASIVYVRLWSQIKGLWQFTDYAFAAP